MGSEQTIPAVVIIPAVKAAVVTAPPQPRLSRWLYRVGGATPQHDAADGGAAFGR